MDCPECQKRRAMLRDAFISGKFIEAARQAAIGAVEIIQGAEIPDERKPEWESRKSRDRKSTSARK